MGRLTKFCEKIVNKFIDVFFGIEPLEEEPEEKCSYTFSSIFPSKEVENEALEILAKLREEKNKEEVSN